MTLDDAMKFFSKSWWQIEVEKAVLVHLGASNFTEPMDWKSMLMTLDLDGWMGAVKLEYDHQVSQDGLMG